MEAWFAPYVADGLHLASWGFAAETGTHVLRLIYSGLFDKFPRLQMIIGHLGEMLPFAAYRVDRYYGLGGAGSGHRLKRLPSEYLRSNFHVTTSGMNWEPAVRQTITVMGAHRVMYAADWPFEDAVDATRRFIAMNLSTAERDKLAHRNAERLFRIAPL